MHILQGLSDTVESFVVEVDENNFTEEVIQKSSTVPVLVDFWATWCGPCKTLTPMLEKLASKHNGAFVLAKVNVDENQRLAMQFQVRSVPAVFMIKDGAVVDGFLGAQPEKVIEQFLAKHISGTEQEIEDPIDRMIAQGDFKNAMRALEQDDSDESRVRRATIHMLQGNLEATKSLLKTVSADGRRLERYKALKAQIHFIEIVGNSEPINQLTAIITREPTNWDAHYKIASYQLLNGEIETALAGFLNIIRHDRHYNDDAARIGLVMAFDLLGSDDERVTKYRRLLASTLH